jgi:uncharacterized membrane protein
MEKDVFSDDDGRFKSVQVQENISLIIILYFSVSFIIVFFLYIVLIKFFS